MLSLKFQAYFSAEYRYEHRCPLGFSKETELSTVSLRHYILEWN